MEQIRNINLFLRLDSGACLAAFLQGFPRDEQAAFLLFQHFNAELARAVMHRAPVILIAMKPDLEKYAACLERPDLSEAQKEDVILALWQIMESFADRAFGLHPVDQAGIGCINSVASGKLGLIESNLSPHTAFEAATTPARCNCLKQTQED